MCSWENDNHGNALDLTPESKGTSLGLVQLLALMTVLSIGMPVAEMRNKQTPFDAPDANQ
jgi:hypothetical protein